jgi:hypothetical protein
VARSPVFGRHRQASINLSITSEATDNSHISSSDERNNTHTYHLTHPASIHAIASTSDETGLVAEQEGNDLSHFGRIAPTLLALRSDDLLPESLRDLISQRRLDRA